MLLADIAGYTSFLSETELEHAHDILTALLETIVNHLGGLLTISKLEGDAVFAYGEEQKLPRGESLLEMIEVTYLAFRDHAENAYRRTTCECRACRAIPTLDLKFMVHHGDFIVQNIAGIRELVGSNVNLIHRLMKNHVSEATGWKAYALFTAKSLDHLALKPEGFVELSEAYEHLGDVQIYCMDMHRRYQELKDALRVSLTAEESDVVIDIEVAAPPPVVWDWVHAPRKRLLWADFNEYRQVLREDGRTGSGSQSHCIHDSKVVNTEIIRDWRPFESWTQDSTTGPITQTVKIEPLEGGRGSRVSMYFRGKMALPDLIRKPMLKAMLVPMMKKNLKKLGDLIAAEQAAANFDAALGESG